MDDAKRTARNAVMTKSTIRQFWMNRLDQTEEMVYCEVLPESKKYFVKISYVCVLSNV